MLAFLLLVFPMSCALPQIITGDQDSREELVHVSIKKPVSERHQDHREKRDVWNLHPTIDVTIKTTNDDVINLSLKRKRRTTRDPPVYSATRGGFVRDDIKVATEESSFYRNTSNNAALTVKWRNGTVNGVYGSFMEKGQMHLIEPVKHNRADYVSSDDVIPHTLSKVDFNFDYLRDAIVLDDDTRHTPLQTISQRRRRHAGQPTELYVEYGIVADYKNYQMWHDAESSNVDEHLKDVYTKARMVEFYEHLVNSINVIFETTHSKKYNIHIVFAGIIIFNDTWTPPWTDRYATCPGCNTVNDFLVLQQFSEWSAQYLQNIIPHDHAALFTGFDLYYKERETHKTVGLSYLSKMCGNWSVSVVEEKRNAITVHIAAHELGHNFGARHDGRSGAEFCSESDLYLMASKIANVNDSTKSGNPWTFSPCSLSSIYDYIDRLTSDRQNCMLGVPQLVDLRFAISPGLTYTADYQCQAMFGNQSRVCRNYHFNNWKRVCFGLACWDAKDNLCKVIFPHDGTPCGYKQWCQQGHCVNSSQALSVDDFCPFGDNPFHACTQEECRPSNNRPGDCCSTCRHMYQTTAQTTQTTHTTYDVTRPIGITPATTLDNVHSTNELNSRGTTATQKVRTSASPVATKTKPSTTTKQATPTTTASLLTTTITVSPDIADDDDSTDNPSNPYFTDSTTNGGESTSGTDNGDNNQEFSTAPSNTDTSTKEDDKDKITPLTASSKSVPLTTLVVPKSSPNSPTSTTPASSKLPVFPKSSPNSQTSTLSTTSTRAKSKPPVFTHLSRVSSTSTATTPVSQVVLFTPEMEASLAVFMSLTMML